jgi:hypothetical protein
VSALNNTRSGGAGVFHFLSPCCRRTWGNKGHSMPTEMKSREEREELVFDELFFVLAITSILIAIVATLVIFSLSDSLYVVGLNPPGFFEEAGK